MPLAAPTRGSLPSATTRLHVSPQVVALSFTFVLLCFGSARLDLARFGRHNWAKLSRHYSISCRIRRQLWLAGSLARSSRRMCVRHHVDTARRRARRRRSRSSVAAFMGEAWTGITHRLFVKCIPVDTNSIARLAATWIRLSQPAWLGTWFVYSLRMTYWTV